MDIMRELGLFEDILRHTPEPGKLNLTGFRHVSGAEGHEHLFTVRLFSQLPRHITPSFLLRVVVSREAKPARRRHPQVSARGTITTTPCPVADPPSRAALIDILAKRLDADQAHHGKRCLAIEPSPTGPRRSVMRFTDGTSAEADVVLVANGVKSRLREAATGVPGSKSMSFGNTVCYRGLVVKERADALGVDTTFWHTPSLVMGIGKVGVVC